MNRLQYKMAIKAITGMVLIGAGIGIIACQSHKNQLKLYPCYEATIEDIPPASEVEAIMVSAYNLPWETDIALIVGDPNYITKKITKWKIRPDTIVVNDQKKIQQITNHFRSAERIIRPGVCLPLQVVFVTKHGAYLIELDGAYEDDIIYGYNYRSEQLFQDFCEVGLINKHRPDSGGNLGQSPIKVTEEQIKR